MNDDLRRCIIGGGTAIEIRKKAVDTGMITLRRCGLLNAMRGVTTIEEVMRHTVGEDIDRSEGLKKTAPEAAESEQPAAPAAAG